MPRHARTVACVVGLLSSFVAASASLVLPPLVTNATATSLLPVATQFVYPVGDPDIEPTYGNSSGNGYAITQGFNTSCDPGAGQGQYYDGYYFCGHTGVDLGDASYGGEVRSMAAGLVVSAGYNGTYGDMVRIEHLLPNGSIVYSQYEHCGSIGVWDGEIVASGQQIGVVGASGFALGPHLHFEIKDTNSDGPGYTFGNAALLAGFYDPLAFVAAHMVVAVPTQAPVQTATAVLPALPTSQPSTPSTNSENAAILDHFLQQYHHFVVVAIPALRLRAGPSLKAKQVSIVTKNAKLALLGVSGSWLHVALPGDLNGWVDSMYVTGTIPASMRPIVQPRVTSGAHIGAPKTRVGAFRATATPTPTSKRPADIRRLGPLAEVLTDGVRVHQDPGVDAGVLFQAYHGSMVAVRSIHAGWAQVTFTNGATGWILLQFLRMPSETSNAATTHTAQQASTDHPVDIRLLGTLAEVLTDGVRVHQGPALDQDVLFQAYHGSMVAVRAIHVSWAQVTFTNGATGWILRHYLRMPAQTTAASQPRRTCSVWTAPNRAVCRPPHG